VVKTTEFDGCALLEAHLGDLPRASARVWGCLGGAGEALSICTAYDCRKATIQLVAAFLKNERRTFKTSSKRDEDPLCHDQVDMDQPTQYRAGRKSICSFAMRARPL